MKNVMVGLLGIYALMIGSSARADNFSWHPVLICESSLEGRPTVEVDNRSYYSNNRLSQGELLTEAQVVIRNPQVVRYFNNEGVGTITYNPNGMRGWDVTVAKIQDGQWIATGESETGNSPMRSFKGANSQLNFPTGNNFYYYFTVSFDGSGLSVTAKKDSQHTANWYFHNCVAQ